MTASASPRVSIVIPTYNSESHLAATISSVLLQTFTDWELVVYDDGSSDATVELAERCTDGDPRVRVARGANGGVAAARNRGFAATQPGSEFVIFLDHDDVWEPELLETLVALLDAEPQLVSAHSVCSGIDKEGAPYVGDNLAERMRSRRGYRDGSVVALDPEEPTTFADLAYDNWIVTPGLHLMRRSSFERVGGFDPETVPCDDYDLSVRLARLGPIGYCERALLHWRRHDQTLSGASPHWRRAEQRARTKMLTDQGNSSEQVDAARRGYRRRAADTLLFAASQVRRHQLRSSVRQSAKAAFFGYSYLRADLALRLHRGT